MRVLIVEDEPLIARFLERGLRSEGYTVGLADDGNGAIEMVKDGWDLIILDLLLPHRDGFEVLREISSQKLRVPVLVLSARRGVETKVAALDAGANDYLAKPFVFDELLARVRAQLRREPVPADRARREVGELGFSLDGGRRKLELLDGRRVVLSEREFALLEYLGRSPNEIVSRERILNAVWKYQFDPRSNVVDVYVARLRRKLEPTVRIETVRGGGYRLLAG